MLIIVFLLLMVKVIYICMRIVIPTTGSSTTSYLESSLPAIQKQKIKKVGDVTRNRTIPVSLYIPVDKVLFPHISSRDTITDLLWHAIYFNTTKSFHTRPRWNGYMSEVAVGYFSQHASNNRRQSRRHLLHHFNAHLYNQASHGGKHYSASFNFIPTTMDKNQ